MMDELYLERMQELVVKSLKKDFLQIKIDKYAKKQLGFNKLVSDSYAETYHFGCKSN